jgi:microcystin-dependent protein
MAQPYVGEIILAGFNFAPVGYAFCDGQLLPISQNETLFALIGTTYGGDGQVTFALPDLRSRVPLGTGQGPGLSGYTLAEPGGTEAVTLTVPQTPAHGHAVNATGLTAAVRARDAVGNQALPAGNVFARDTPAPFTDAVTAGSPIRAVQIAELRTRINAYRSSVALAAFTFTDATLVAGTTPIKAVHVLELRTSLQQAYTQAGLTPPAFTDPALANVPVKAVHLTELRSAMAAVDSAPGTYSSAAPTAGMHAGTIALAGGGSAVAGGSQPHDNRQPYLAINYCIALEGIFPPMN